MKKRVAVLTSLMMLAVLTVSAYGAEDEASADHFQQYLAEMTASDAPDFQDLSEMKASSFETNTSDHSRPSDEGHIYVGYAISDGQPDSDNSNWETEDVQNIALRQRVEGEGFTAVRAFGDTTVNVTGSLILQDGGDGTYASDITGTGAGITAAEGARVYADEMTYLSTGFLRSFGVVENAALVITNSDILALGGDPLTDAYDDPAQTSGLPAPPWMQGVRGGVRAVNVMGEKNSSTFVAANSTITSGGWAAVAADACTAPQLYFYNTELNLLPESEGGANSGFKILGYEEDLYGSGYGTSCSGDAAAGFYGTVINGATYGSVLNGGTATYEGMKAGTAYEAAGADGTAAVIYEATEDLPTVVNTVWGVMSDGSGTVNFNEGSVWNSAEGTVLCKEAGAVWNFNGAQIHPANGIIFQMMDNDGLAAEEAGSSEAYFTEKTGFPEEGMKTGSGQMRKMAQVRFANGTYEGQIYNGTGYYDQAADGIRVTIAEDAVLKGDIALTSHVHGIFLYGRDVDDIIAAIEEADAYHENTDDITYVFLDEEGEVTEEKEDAAAIQFTKFSPAEYYLIGHVINKIHYNGQASIDVTVEGTWKPAGESLITYLNIKEGAHVYGELAELEDGSILVVPSNEALAPGEYGTASADAEAPE